MHPSYVTLDIVTYQNVDFAQVLQWVDGNGLPSDLSGSTFKMDIAASAGADPALSLVEAAGIELTDLTNGKITVLVPAGALAVGPYVYDLVRIDAFGARDLLARGKFEMKQGVTQP